MELASDHAGTRLEFANVSPSGGLIWRYQGEKDWRDAGAVACRINDRPVMVQEARFGGVLAEPLREGEFNDHINIIDLRRS